METIRVLLESQVLFTLFLTIAVGYLVGEINIKGFSLGSGAVLFVGLAIDLYEQEADLFFRDLSNSIVTDDTFQRLLSFPNVIITGHQAFFTEEAITTICQTTIESVSEFAEGRRLSNEIKAG